MTAPDHGSAESGFAVVSGETATHQLTNAGVSIWLDDLSRDRLTSGNLGKLIAEKDVAGITTNPTIFAAALANSDAYSEQLLELAKAGVNVDNAVETITTTDVRNAADLFLGTYKNSGGIDGRVSIEVDPRLSRDTAGTVAAARRLWKTIDRPNVMIKIPATVEGLPAIATALGDGISVNVTLIFSIERYREVMNAYLSGLEAAKRKGLDLSKIQSVASFFISRVDTEVDPLLDAAADPSAKNLKGVTAIANAVEAYDAYRDVFERDVTGRWAALAAAGATPQRPLWASTGVKNPNYPDTMYVTELVAPGVVNTMPEATLNAVADHGQVRGDTVSGSVASARNALRSIEAHGINMADVTQKLEDEGLAKFEDSWAQLLDTVHNGLAVAARDNAVSQ